MKLFAAAVSFTLTGLANAVGEAQSPVGGPTSGPCRAHEYCSPREGRCFSVPPGGPVPCVGGKCPSSGQGEVCDNLIGMCMVPGAACASDCKNTSTYCCPIGEHCFVPHPAGVVCQSRADCFDEEYCCPATKVCVVPDVQTVCNPNGNATLAH